MNMIERCQNSGRELTIVLSNFAVGLCRIWLLISFNMCCRFLKKQVCHMVDWDLAKIVQLSAVCPSITSVLLGMCMRACSDVPICSSSYWLWPIVLVVNHVPAVMHAHTHTWVPWMKVAENHRSFGHVWGQRHMHLDQLYFIYHILLHCIVLDSFILSQMMLPVSQPFGTWPFEMC